MTEKKVIFVIPDKPDEMSDTALAEFYKKEFSADSGRVFPADVPMDARVFISRYGQVNT